MFASMAFDAEDHLILPDNDSGEKMAVFIAPIDDLKTKILRSMVKRTFGRVVFHPPEYQLNW